MLQSDLGNTVQSELSKLADYLSEFSHKTFAGDVLASILNDLEAGLTAADIIEDLRLDDPENYE